jgi:hypothetical protein
MKDDSSPDQFANYIIASPDHFASLLSKRVPSCCVDFLIDMSFAIRESLCLVRLSVVSPPLSHHSVTSPPFLDEACPAVDPS